MRWFLSSSCLQSESVKYFLDNLDRIGQLVSQSDSWSALRIALPLPTEMFVLPFQNYIPSKQDILFARKATKGIVEHDFVIKKIPFKMVDVGGQRSQRQKWFQCFDGITSILFMVSSSEYDQVSFRLVSGVLLALGNAKRARNIRDAQYLRFKQSSLCGRLWKLDCSLSHGCGSNQQSYDDERIINRCTDKTWKNKG